MPIFLSPSPGATFCEGDIASLLFNCMFVHVQYVCVVFKKVNKLYMLIFCHQQVVYKMPWDVKT